MARRTSFELRIAVLLAVAACACGEDGAKAEPEIPKGDAGRRMYFELRCAEGHAGMCGELGVMWKKGWGGPRDDAKAASYFQRACDGGIPTSCVEIGKELPPERQIAILDEGCAKGNAFACNNLGHLLWLGEDVKHDETKARGLLEKGCAGGFAASCSGLVKMWGAGIGGPKDEAKALEWKAEADRKEAAERAREAKYLHTPSREELPVGKAKPAMLDAMKRKQKENKEANRGLLDGVVDPEKKPKTRTEPQPW